MPRRHDDGLVEDADIGTSSEDYARRFTGAAGRWFVETQTRITLGFLGRLPVGASILDVGGGHARSRHLSSRRATRSPLPGATLLVVSDSALAC